MHFRAEHEFPGSVAAVIAILCDPMFHTALDLPDMSRPEVVEHVSSGTEHVLKLRYEFTGSLDPIARKILAGRQLAWIQELRIDTTTGRGRLSFQAEAEPKRLNGSADVALVRRGSARTTRHIEGDLFVKVPLVGATAERRIVPGLVRRLDVEAAAVTAALGT